MILLFPHYNGLTFLLRGVDYIVTYNKQDFIGVDDFGVKIVDAREFLHILGELS